jgi:hypothetical protein
MIRVSKESLEHLRLELDQIATSAFFMETYTMGLRERVSRLKKYIDGLEMVATRPETATSEK